MFGCNERKNDVNKLSESVKIAFITDDNYVVPTVVAIQSLVNSFNDDRQCDIFVVCDAVSDLNKKHFADCARNKKNVRILAIDADAEELAMLHKSINSEFMVANTTALLKFNLANMFSNIDKLLYLDGDILVNCDVSEIYDIELNDNYVAAVRDLPQVFYDKQDFGEDTEYFNSGVMLLNLAALRAENVRDQLIETKRSSINDKLMDQNVLNKVFRGRVIQMHFEYNMPYCLFSTLRRFKYDRLNEHYDGVDINCLDDLRDYGKIIHFSSYLKPWIFSDSPYAEEWYNVFRLSPVANIPLTRVSCENQNLVSFKTLKKILKNKNKFDAEGKSVVPLVDIEPQFDVSIIIPCYNQEKTIRDCLKSAISQTLQNIEIIVVNDRSTDSSLEILDELQAECDKIKIINFETNQGTSNARKAGVLASRGRYVMFLDSDDALEENACEILYNEITSKGVDILQFGVKVVDCGVSPKTLEWFKWFSRPFTDVLTGSDIFFACHESNKLAYILWNKIYDGTLARKAFSHVSDGYFIMGEDLYVHAMMLYFAKTYSGITDPLYIYNYGQGLTGNSSMGFSKFSRLCSQLRLMELLYKFFDENEFVNYTRYIKAVNKINENFFNNICNNYSKCEQSEKDECFAFLLESLVPKIPRDDYVNEAIYSACMNNFLKALDVLYYAKYPRRMAMIYDFAKSYLRENGFLEQIASHFNGRLVSEIYKNREFDEVDRSIIVPVVFASNMSYAPCVGVSIQSLLDNSSNDRFYDIYVLHSNIDEYTQKLISQHVTQNSRVSFINLKGRVDNMKLYTNFHISVETYFRFFIPEVIYRYDKVLYLDCDIAINDDIAKLYDEDVDKYTVGAIHNQLHKQSTIDYIRKTLGLNPDKYFNAGVLLMNCKKFDELDVKGRAFEELRKKRLMLMDQDALNIVCANNYKELDGRWNYQVGCEKYTLEDKYSADVGIYHYTSANKPWTTKNTALGEKFWQYARKSPFYEQLLVTLMQKSLNIDALKKTESSTGVVATKPSNNSNNPKKTKKKHLITWPFRMIRGFFVSLKNNGLRYTMSYVKVKLKYVFNRLLGRVDKNNQPKKKKNEHRYDTQTSIYAYYKALPEKKYSEELQNWFNKRMGEKMNIDSPKTFNQKIQWLKLYDSTLVKSHLTDKWLAKEYAESVLGEEYVIKTIGVYDSFDQIDFEKLPAQFVIKSTHGSGQIAIIKDKSKLDVNQLRTKVEGWLKINYAYNLGLELHYANIIPRIIIEEYMSGINDDLYDYKFVCINGKVEMLWVDTNRFSGHKRTLFSPKWKVLDCKLQFENSEKPIPRPAKLNKLIEFSEKLAKPFSLVRCDFYVLSDGSIKFGELTFTSGSGVDSFDPYEYDVMLGEKIVLPEPQKFKKLSRKQIMKSEQEFLNSLK